MLFQHLCKGNKLSKFLSLKSALGTFVCMAGSWSVMKKKIIQGRWLPLVGSDDVQVSVMLRKSSKHWKQPEPLDNIFSPLKSVIRKISRLVGSRDQF